MACVICLYLDRQGPFVLICNQQQLYFKCIFMQNMFLCFDVSSLKRDTKPLPGPEINNSDIALSVQSNIKSKFTPRGLPPNVFSAALCF